MTNPISKRRRKAHTRLYDLQDGKCCYCQRPMCPDYGRPLSATVEHLRRIADGGTWRWDNLALACHECNTGRGAMDWFTYASYRRGELAAC